MKLENLPGIDLYVSFDDHYLKRGRIDRTHFLRDIDREKFGYLWDIPPRVFGLADLKHNLIGFYASNSIDAMVILGYFNRTFYELAKMKLIRSVEDTWCSPDMDLAFAQWHTFESNLRNMYKSTYIPVKKFLSQKNKYPFWFNLRDRDNRESKIVYHEIMWFFGDKINIIEAPDAMNEIFDWADYGIKIGPMGNPELPLIDHFAHCFPESVKYIPKKIVNKLDIDHLDIASDFGII